MACPHIKHATQASYRMMYFPHGSLRRTATKKSLLLLELFAQEVALHTWDMLGKKVARLGPNSLLLASLFPKYNVGTKCTNTYALYSKLNAIHMHINSLLHTCKRGRCCSWGQGSPSFQPSVCTSPIQHFSQVLNILQSWTTHAHKQDFQTITVTVGWFSYLEEAHLNWICKKTFHGKKPVCVGKQSLCEFYH